MRQRREALIDEALREQKRVVGALQAATESCWLQLDLTITQIKGLFALTDEGAMTVGQVAETLGIGRPAASILVDGLVNLHLVERSDDPSDRRRAIVRLSPTGEELVTRLYRGERDFWRGLFGQLGDDDLTALVHGLRALAGAVAADGFTHRKTRDVMRTTQHDGPSGPERTTDL